MADKESDQLTAEVQNLIAVRELYKVSVSETYSPVGYCVSGGGFGFTLRGYVVTTFATLCKTFGPPKQYPDPSAEWTLHFDDERFVLIFLHRLKFIPKSLYLWHVGGRSLGDVERVAAILQTSYYVNWELAHQPESHEIQF